VEKRDHDQGLGHDWRVWKAVLGRRRLLQWAAYSAGLIACGGSSPHAPRRFIAYSVPLPPRRIGEL
jgi:hypothetical protein